MSARAAWRLESLGFSTVYRYDPGKKDWMANGLPVEGRQSNVVRVTDLMRRDVPTCGPDARVGEARERALAAGWDDCVVVNDAGVVLGILHRKALESDPDARVGDAMDPGLSTYRLDVEAEQLAHELDEKSVTRALITTSDGELVGMFFVADVIGGDQAATRGAARR
jgi:CBS domain-containing protein